jgi:hypothetical protein
MFHSRYIIRLLERKDCRDVGPLEICEEAKGNVQVILCDHMRTNDTDFIIANPSLLRSFLFQRLMTIIAARFPNEERTAYSMENHDFLPPPFSKSSARKVPMQVLSLGMPRTGTGCAYTRRTCVLAQNFHPLHIYCYWRPYIARGGLLC